MYPSTMMFGSRLAVPKANARCHIECVTKCDVIQTLMRRRDRHIVLDLVVKHLWAVLLSQAQQGDAAPAADLVTDLHAKRMRAAVRHRPGMRSCKVR